MRAHCLQHVPFEGLGNIEPWLTRKGFVITTTRFYASEPLPELNAIDMLIIMGGPMSVLDEADYPWLIEEKAFVRAAVLAGKVVLGVCLGAQLIADAMGGCVYKNRAKEIGWFPIQASVEKSDSVFRFPREAIVFHWHGETFDVPQGAVVLARSVACENQAFQLGRAVIGLQFHLETTPESAKAIVQNCRDELVIDQYIQSEATILAATTERYRAINSLMDEVLTYLHGKIT